MSGLRRNRRRVYAFKLGGWLGSDILGTFQLSGWLSGRPLGAWQLGFWLGTLQLGGWLSVLRSGVYPFGVYPFGVFRLGGRDRRGRRDWRHGLRPDNVSLKSD